MKDHRYLINGRFLLDLQLNCITDTATGIDHRLEPRLIAVLHELLKNPKALVTRQSLIQKIWDDYPGAEDGLNQAISSLRKSLGDDTKDMIKTIPKRGYMLLATVVKQGHGADLLAKSSNKVLLYGAIAVLVLALVGSLVWLSVYRGSGSVNAAQTSDTEVTFPDLKEAEESNYLNTITTTDSVGNRYRLIMIGDRRPRFYVNDSLLPDTEPYTLLVDKLARELWRRQKEAAE